MKKEQVFLRREALMRGAPHTKIKKAPGKIEPKLVVRCCDLDQFIDGTIGRRGSLHDVQFSPE